MRPPSFRLERYLAHLEFSAPFLLCASDCESITIADLLALEDGAADAFRRLSLGYTESAGAPDLRRAISDQYATIEPDEVVVHGAGQEAIFTFMTALLDPGDHVVVHYPSYQSLYDLPRSLGCTVTLWKGRPELGWDPGVETLSELVTEDTKLVVVNVPHSPTGFHMSHEAWRRLLDTAASVGAWVLSDEAYRGLEYNDTERLPAACDLYDRACSLSLLSKGYGLAGLRIAWLATHDQELLNRIQRVKDYTTICSSAPSEFLARLALAHGESLLRASRERIASSLARLNTFFATHADRFDWIPPRAGSVGFPRLIEGDVDAFCRDVLEKKGVLLLPGSVFDPESHHFRVGLGREGLADALEQLDAYLRTNPSVC